MISVTGFDANGIPRVFGEHETSLDVAETRAKETAVEYVRRRRDTGPLDRWTFERGGNDAKLCSFPD